MVLNEHSGPSIITLTGLVINDERALTLDGIFELFQCKPMVTDSVTLVNGIDKNIVFISFSLALT